MPTLEIEWTPEAETLASEYVVLYRRKKAFPGQWTVGGSTRGTRYTLDVADAADTWEIGIAPVVGGIEANEDDWSVAEYRPSDVTAVSAPSSITDFAVAQSGAFIEAAWTQVSETDIDYYEIRQGGTWATSVLIDRVPASSASARFGWRFSGQTTYFIAARNTAGKYSGTPDDANVTISDEQYHPIQATYDEQSAGFTGTKTNVEVSGGYLQLKAVPATASAWTDVADTYTWTPHLSHIPSGTYVTPAKDAGSVVVEKLDVKITPGFTSPTVPANQWYGVVRPRIVAGIAKPAGYVVPLSRITADETLVDGVTYKVEIDTTPDDPAGTPTWDGYRLWNPAARYSFRGVRLKITMTGYWWPIFRLLGFTWKRKRENRKDEASVSVTGTGGTNVTWNTTFTSAPKVTATVITSTEPLFATVETPTTTNCTIRVYDSGGTERSSATVHVTALGV